MTIKLNDIVRAGAAIGYVIKKLSDRRSKIIIPCQSADDIVIDLDDFCLKKIGHVIKFKNI